MEQIAYIGRGGKKLTLVQQLEQYCRKCALQQTHAYDECE